MNFTAYELIYLMSNIFGTYIIFKFMAVFFDRKNVNKRNEMFSYLIFYIVNSAVYIVFDNPMLNLMANLVLLFLITLNYTNVFKRKLVAIVYIYAILISVEAITIIGVSLFNIERIVDGIQLELIINQIVSKILTYVVVLILTNFKMLKTRTHISALHWIAIFIIPISTLTSTAIFMLGRDMINAYEIFISIAILFIVNIFVFYLYDTLLKSYEEKIEKSLLIQQNNAYMLQLDIINESKKNLSIIRHDFKLHLSALRAIIEKGDSQKALNYIKAAFDNIDSSAEHSKTGNIAIDGILNYKIQAAHNKRADVELDIQVPDQLSIQPFHLVAVIGNLLDNAIEAVSQINENDRKIIVKMLYNRNVLYITVINPYQGDIVFENKTIKTHHEDTELRGFGLQSIANTIEKYNGTINVSHENNLFRADVLLYDQ